MTRTPVLLALALGVAALTSPLALDRSTSDDGLLLAGEYCYVVSGGALGIDQGVRICPPLGTPSAPA